VLSILSKNEINMLFKNNIGTDLNNRAHCAIILKYGQGIELKKENADAVTLMYLESNIHIVEYMAENIFKRKITVTIDCTESKGYNFKPISGKFTFDLDSGERRFVMKLIPTSKSDSRELVRK
jgi:hypothetical protein